MAKEANFVFLAIFSVSGLVSQSYSQVFRPCFSAVFPGLVSPDMFPGGNLVLSGGGSPALHRAPLNELRPVHHEAVFGAPVPYRRRGLPVPNIHSVPEKPVFYTECL